MAFLIQKKALESSNTLPKFDFGPDRFGPLSMEIYDELAFLESVKMIKDIGNKKYKITEKGIRFLEKKTFKRVNENIQRKIENIKTEYGRKDLNDLLKYVYITYPEFTVKSEILGRVLDK